MRGADEQADAARGLAADAGRAAEAARAELLAEKGAAARAGAERAKLAGALSFCEQQLAARDRTLAARDRQLAALRREREEAARAEAAEDGERPAVRLERARGAALQAERDALRVRLDALEAAFARPRGGGGAAAGLGAAHRQAGGGGRGEVLALAPHAHAGYGGGDDDPGPPPQQQQPLAHGGGPYSALREELRGAQARPARCWGGRATRAPPFPHPHPFVPSRLPSVSVPFRSLARRQDRAAAVIASMRAREQGMDAAVQRAAQQRGVVPTRTPDLWAAEAAEAYAA